MQARVGPGRISKWLRLRTRFPMEDCPTEVDDETALFVQKILWDRSHERTRDRYKLRTSGYVRAILSQESSK